MTTTQTITPSTEKKNEIIIPQGEIWSYELILSHVGRGVACNVSTDRIRVSRINQQSH